MHLHWHRGDLRPHNLRALEEAAPTAVLPAFVIDPSIVEMAGPARLTVLRQSLAELRAAYRDRGGDLVVVRGRAPNAVPRLVEAVGAETISWTRAYSATGRNRDAAVKSALEETDCRPMPVFDGLLHEPGSITTQSGSAYRVFRYFWEAWRERPVSTPFGVPTAIEWVDIPGPVAGAAEIESIDGCPAGSVPDGGWSAAQARLETFIESGLDRYGTEAAAIEPDATSRLGADLHLGTIGVRTVLARLDAATAPEPPPEGDRASEAFTRQLAWREFYHHLLWEHPSLQRESFRSFSPEPWRSAPEELEAWRAGRTGYPIVDAGMRQLRSEHFLPNRVRMIVASFLTKHLLIHWRKGYEWFRVQLVDHAPANEAGNWQWIASTGPAAQPPYRIFNPMAQAERYDPAAEYITEHVPELRQVSPEQIHSWPTLSNETRSTLADDYPGPIVDQAAAKDRALEAFGVDEA